MEEPYKRDAAASLPGWIGDRTRSSWSLLVQLCHHTLLVLIKSQRCGGCVDMLSSPQCSCFWTIDREAISDQWCLPAVETEVDAIASSSPLRGGAAAVVSSTTLWNGGSTADFEASKSFAACHQIVLWVGHITGQWGFLVIFYRKTHFYCWQQWEVSERLCYIDCHWRRALT